MRTVVRKGSLGLVLWLLAILPLPAAANGLAEAAAGLQRLTKLTETSAITTELVGADPALQALQRFVQEQGVEAIVQLEGGAELVMGNLPMQTRLVQLQQLPAVRVIEPTDIIPERCVVDGDDLMARQLDPVFEAAGSVPWMVSGPEPEAIARRRAQLDIRNHRTITDYGAGVDDALTRVADEMLEGVSARNAGPAGEELNTMVTTLRGLQPSKTRSVVGGVARRIGMRSMSERIVDRAKALASRAQMFEGVKRKIESSAGRLRTEAGKLEDDIDALEKLAVSTEGYLKDLEVLIAGLEEELAAVEAQIPQLEATLGEAAANSFEVRNLYAARNLLERRHHDLLTTQKVAEQALVEVRLVQEQDRTLVGKIRSILVHTVSMWKFQMAKAIAAHRAKKAGATVSAASDLNGHLLRRTADDIREGQRIAVAQNERGIFDPEDVLYANDTLVTTIEETRSAIANARQNRQRSAGLMRDARGRLLEALAAPADMSTLPATAPAHLEHQPADVMPGMTIRDTAEVSVKNGSE